MRLILVIFFLLQLCVSSKTGKIDGSEFGVITLGTELKEKGLLTLPSISSQVPKGNWKVGEKCEGSSQEGYNFVGANSMVGSFKYHDLFFYFIQKTKNQKPGILSFSIFGKERACILQTEKISDRVDIRVQCSDNIVDFAKAKGLYPQKEGEELNKFTEDFYSFSLCRKVTKAEKK